MRRRGPRDTYDEKAVPRPIATYSIAAHDGTSLGVAVQSHWFSVGSLVPWLEPGVGAVAIQSFNDPDHGPRALELLRSGLTAPEVLGALLRNDPEGGYRQTVIIDIGGRVATHTGSLCIPAAGHSIGDGFSTQANLMAQDTVWGAMADAFERTDGDMAERLLVALETAEAEGGDIRGRQSAAIVVVAAEATGAQSEDWLFDLRVEDHPEPVAELRRLVQLRRGYVELIAGDNLVSKGDMEQALEAYQSAMELIPDQAINGEAAFWTGITLAGEGRAEEALPYLRRAQAQHDVWVRLVPRLISSEILPDDSDLIDFLVAGMTGETR
jgi:uncharacterized Ntn-hydrolase superfamily protein